MIGRGRGSSGRPVACDTPGRLKERSGGLVRLDLAWRDAPPIDPSDLAGRVVERGRRWSVRLPADQAQRTLGQIRTGIVLRLAGSAVFGACCLTIAARAYRKALDS